MTFLEFVMKRLHGPPPWSCPFCDSRRGSFSIRPPKDDYPIKFKCFRCGEWGDEYDLMKLFYPEDDYPRRKGRLDVWRLDYEREGYSFRGMGRVPSVNPHYQGQDYHVIQDIHGVCMRDVEIAWADLLEDFHDEETGENFALQVLNTFKAHCDRNNVAMEALLRYWRRFELWSIQGEIRHRYSHIPFFRWPEAAQDDYLMACAREEAENMTNN